MYSCRSYMILREFTASSEMRSYKFPSNSIWILCVYNMPVYYSFIIILKWHNWVNIFGSVRVFTNWPTQYLTSLDVTKSTPWNSAFLENFSCFLVSQESPLILCTAQVHYRACKGLPLLRVMSQINPVHTHSFYIRFIWKLYLFLLVSFKRFLWPNILYL